ncbi:MAG: Cdc6/Cdc18 family protein [Candidatus Micrarchaeia archaeon]|jgi:cell division control protein 6
MELKDIVASEGIFLKNRNVLSPHYLPNTLLYRDEEINKIRFAIAPALKGERGKNLFIYGKTGTGKTCCTRKVIEEIKQLPEIKTKVSYVNCRVYSSRYRVFTKIISEHLPTYAKSGYGLPFLYERFIDWIEEDGKTFIVILDEVDMVKDLDELVYTLSRANDDIKNGGVSMIGISNKVSFKERLDPRTRSTLYEDELIFTPYTSTQLFGILKQRVEEGFNKDTVDEEALAYAAAIGAKENGDARYALKLLAKATEIAEQKKLNKITKKEIEEARKSVEEEIVDEAIATLPEHQQLLLYAIACSSEKSYQKLNDGKEKIVLSGEAYSRYYSIAKGLKKEPKSSRWCREYINDLESLGIIKTQESGKGIRGHTKLITLLYPAEKIKKVIQRKFSL